MSVTGVAQPARLTGQPSQQGPGGPQAVSLGVAPCCHVGDLPAFKRRQPKPRRHALEVLRIHLGRRGVHRLDRNVVHSNGGAPLRTVVVASMGTAGIGARDEFWRRSKHGNNEIDNAVMLVTKKWP